MSIDFRILGIIPLSVVGAFVVFYLDQTVGFTARRYG